MIESNADPEKTPIVRPKNAASTNGESPNSTSGSYLSKVIANKRRWIQDTRDHWMNAGARKAATATEKSQQRSRSQARGQSKAGPVPTPRRLLPQARKRIKMTPARDPANLTASKLTTIRGG